MITLKMRLDLDGLPHQWHPQPMRHHNNEPLPTPANTAKPSAQKNSKAAAGNTHMAQSSTPTTTLRTNVQWPHIFASNDTLKMLREKQGHTLSNIFSEAGISGGGECLDLMGLPDNLCLRWLILGKCSGGRKGEACNQTHPTTGLPTKASEAVFQQIKPGLKRIAEQHKKQRTE